MTTNTDEALAVRLADALTARDEAERGVYDVVDQLRAAGYSWQRVGELLGVSRQAAWERYGDS